MTSTLTKAAIAIVAVSTVAAASTVFGTVSDNDVHILNGTVANRFFDPAPGRMYEVVDGTATALCSYSNADSGTARDQPRREIYYNALGRNLPIAQMISQLIQDESFSLQVEISRTVYNEGLGDGFEGTMTPECEARAHAAHANGSTVCIVSSVVRWHETDEIVGVRFKPYGFAPASTAAFPRCDLRAEGDVFWQVRGTFVSLTTTSVGINSHALAQG